MSQDSQSEISLENSGRSPKILTFFAHFISYIMHPVFMPLLMTMALYKLTPVSFAGLDDHKFGLWLLNIGITTIFFPLFSIGLLKPLGFISSFKMPTTKERIVPLIITMTFYFWVSNVFNKMPGVNVPVILKILLLGNFWGIILVFLLNIFTKVSLHTSAAGGVIGNIIVLMIKSPVNMEIPLFIVLILGGIIGTARLLVGAHQKGDVWLGFVVGIVVQLAAFAYFSVF